MQRPKLKIPYQKLLLNINRLKQKKIYRCQQVAALSRKCWHFHHRCLNFLSFELDCVYLPLGVLRILALARLNRCLYMYKTVGLHEEGVQRGLMGEKSSHSLQSI